MQPNENYDPNAAQPQPQPQSYPQPEQPQPAQPQAPVYAPEPAVQQQPVGQTYAQPAAQQPVAPQPVAQPQAPVEQPVANPFGQPANNPFAAASDPAPVQPQQSYGSAPAGFAPETAAPVAGAAKKFPKKLVIIIASVVVALAAILIIGLPLLNKAAPGIVPESIVSNGIVPAAELPLQDYQSTAGKFSMKIPEGWTSKEEVTGGIAFIGFAKAEEDISDATVTKSASIIVICTDTAAMGSTKKYTREEYLATAKSGDRGENTTVKSEGDVTVNGLSGYKVIADVVATKDGVTKNVFSASLSLYIDETRGCAVSISGNDTETELEDSIDTILNSFKVS